MGFFQTLGQGYQIMGQEAKQKIADNRANIWTGVSVAGTIGTAILSWINGAKSARQIDAEEVALGRPLTFKEKAKLCWKNTLAPAATVIGSGAGAITSNRIQAGDIARLTTDVAVVTKAYNEFKKASNEVLDEKQQQKVQHVIGEEKRQNIDQKELDKLVEPEVPEGAARLSLYYEPTTGVSWFSNNDKIQAAVAEMKAEMKSLRPRTEESGEKYELGVNLYKLFEYTDAMSPEELASNLRHNIIFKHYGFNKGFWKDYIDDDDCISYTLDPGEVMYHGEMRLCYVINWDFEPSDMRCGKQLKRPF